MHSLVLNGDRITAGEALTTCGEILHTTLLFPSLKPSFVPLSWYLSALCTLCKEDPKKWERAKSRHIEIPAVLRCMVHDAWLLIKNRKQHALKFVKLVEDADLSISTDWCPKGFGVVDHISGDFEGIVFPLDHPIYTLFRKHSLWGELFAVIMALLTLASEGQVVTLAEDNMGCISAVKNFKSQTSYSALSQYFAKVVREKNLTIIPRYMDTDTIPADPISRLDKPNWASDFSSRCKRLKIPTGRRRTGLLKGWTDLWNDIMRVEAEYSLLS